MANFYCNQKFWFLLVDLGKFETSSCCAATPQKINLSWTKDNPGQIFNTPEIQHDRALMLENKPTTSCAVSCWNPEEKGIISRRLSSNGQEKTHLNVVSSPETLTITVGSDCNMTCVYCCKFYSTAWGRDVEQNQYQVAHVDDRFRFTKKDKILQSIGQKDMQKSATRQLVLDEVVKLYQSQMINEIMIIGGEPFLYLDLHKLISTVPDNLQVSIFSGLGVNEKRFAQEIKKLPKNATVVISAESIGSMYEFVRYGNTWERFTNNLAQLKSAGINYRFNCTVSNLTVVGLKDFIKWAGDVPMDFQPCTDPDYLSIGVLDPETKKLVQSDMSELPEFVSQALVAEPSKAQIDNFKIYVREFAGRRQLKFDILPKSLENWIMS
jgi:organic radical activating enzyme